MAKRNTETEEAAAEAEPSSRDKIVMAASRLLESQGYHGTGIAQLVAESGAPKGSVYFHFPGGKEQIACEALLHSGRVTAERTREGLAGARGARAIRAFIEGIAFHVEDSGFRSGGPLLIVASEMATQSEPLAAASREAYDLIHAAFQARLATDGLGPKAAAALATTIMAAVEGGIALSRAYRTGDPLRQIAKDMAELVKAAQEKK